MKAPDLATLTETLAKKNYRNRQRYLAEIATCNHGTPEFATLLDELEAVGDVSGASAQRYAYIFMAIVAQDQERVLSALHSPYRSVRKMAASACVQVAGDRPELVEVVMGGSPDVAKAVLGGIARRCEGGIVEALFQRLLAERGIATAARLLPGCGEDLVKQHFSKAYPHVSAWKLMVRRHPSVVLEWIRAEAGRSLKEYNRPGCWQQMLPLLRPLLAQHQSEVLAFICDHAKAAWELPGELQAFLWRMAANGRSKALLRLMFSKQNLSQMRYEDLPGGFRTHAGQLPKPVVEELVSGLITRHQCALVPLLRRLAPSLRGELISNLDPKKLDGLRWEAEFLSILPHRLRQKLAASELERQHGKLHATSRRGLIALLDYDDAWPEVEALIGAAKPEDRNEGYHLLLNCARHNPHRFADVLEQVGERTRNEQDPVRCTIISGMAQLPDVLLRAPELLRHLQSICQASLDARDVSYQTMNNLAALIGRTLVANSADTGGELFQGALVLLTETGRKSGHFHIPQMAAGLRRGTESLIVEAFEPVIEDLKRREQFELIGQLAQSLGERGWQVPKLGALLGDAILGNLKSTGHLIQHWLADPRTRGERVITLLERDASAIVLHEVFSYIDRWHQDRLARYLEGKAISGAFLTGKSVYLLPAHASTYRWWPAQQCKFATLIKSFVQRKPTTDREKRSYLRTLTKIPEVQLGDLQPMLEHEDLVVQEGTLAALAELEDVTKAIPLLLANLDSDRARVAMYTLPRCLATLPPDQIAGLIEEILARPSSKVTVRKEAVRLLGRFQTPSSVATLERVVAKKSQHRHVIAAAAQSAREMIEHEDAWQLLEKMAADSRKDVPLSLLGVSDQRFTHAQRQRYCLLILKLAQHEKPIVRAALFGNLSSWMRGSERAVAEVASRAVCDLTLSDPPLWELAANVLLVACAEPEAAPILAETMDALSRIRHPDDAGAKRDCPQLQRLAHLVDGFRSMSEYARELNAATMHPAVHRLIEPAETECLGIRLFIAAYRWDKLEDVGRFIEFAAALDGKRNAEMQFVVEVEESLATCSQEWLYRLLPVYEELVATDSYLAKRAAFQILTTLGASSGWPTECREKLLIDWRQHPDAERRALGYSVFTSPERPA